jgi:protein with PEP-CTERM/exosortase system signal
MKISKFLAIALTSMGGLTLAQATGISFSPTGMSSIDGNNYYTWGINWSVPTGDTISGATLTFNNLTLTSFGNNNPGYVWTHLLDTSSGTGTTGVTLGTDNDLGTDAFAGKGILLGQQFFPALNKPQTFSYSLDPAILSSYAADGHFAIGIDPDCHYTDSSIVLSFTYAPNDRQQVPDAASTAGLLALTLPLLGFFRRRK